MYEPHFDHRLVPDAIPVLARFAGALLAFLIIGGVALGAFVTGA